MPQTGDSDFEAFYAGSVNRLTSQFYAMTGNLGEAEDLVQEAFARAWQRWRTVSAYESPEAWVRKVALRLRINVWRKAVSRTRAYRRYGEPAHVPGGDPDFVAIVAALREIPESQRQAIVLFHLVDLTLEQISRETGAPLGTVKARLSRGRRALADLLDDGSRGPAMERYKKQEVSRHV